MPLNFSESSNAIIVPIELKLDNLEKLEEVVGRLRDADKKLPAAEKAMTPEEDEMLEKTMGNMLLQGGKSANSLMSNTAGFFNNPLMFILNIVSNPYVAAAIIGAASAKMILDRLMLQGNILDKHFKRIITAERNAGRRRESRQAIRAGLGVQVIFTNESGSTSPEYAFNSYAARRNGEIDAMKIFQIRKGYKF